MRKNLFLILIVAALIGITALPALAARREATPEQVEALFNRQSALSQKDVDAFLKHASAILDAQNDDDINAAFKEAGFSNIRGHYVLNKLKIGYRMLEEPDYGELLMTQQSDLPKALIPTEGDMALIKKNKRALGKIFDK